MAGIAVIGIGLIGGSIIRDLQKTISIHEKVYGISDDPSAINARGLGLIHEILTYSQLPEKVDFIVISSPILTIPDIAKRIHQAFATNKRHKTVIVIDVASVKKSITRRFEQLSTPKVEFIATHPMAGTEFTGLEHARLSMFRGKPWIISRHRKNSDAAINRVEVFINQLGGRVKELDASQHDMYAAAVSHTTILLSNYIFEFLAGRYPEALDLAGSGFDSTTRLASGNPELHASIMQTNTDKVDEIMHEFQEFLRSKNSVKELAADYFTMNKQQRDRWLSKKTIINDDKS